MDKNHLKTTINNNNQEHPLSPTIITIPNNDTRLHETDRFLHERASTHVLSDLPRSRNLEETDENELPFPGFVDQVFYCLKQTTTPRYQCLQLITSPWFERISMFVILLNCITLGMYQPCEHHSGIEGEQGTKKCDTARCIWLQATDYFIFGFFTIEMCIKMTAMGIFGKGTYLADTWNRLDCFIVVTGLIESVIPGENVSLSAIRTVRVLRPLRAINRVPSMRILVMLLLDTLPMLGNVLLLCFFVFFIFGIIGVQLWKGLLRNRCFLQLDQTIRLDESMFGDTLLRPFYIPLDQDSFVCSPAHSSGMTKCTEIPKLRKGNMTCELDYHSYTEQLSRDPHKPVNGCVNWNQYYKFCNVSDKNPYAGSISFDNIGLAWVVIFQIISLESWVNIMYYIQDAHSFWDWIYFVCLIVIGSFFMINLCLVVIATQFSETKKRETERMLAERRRFSRSSSTLLSDEPGSCWEETIKYLERLWKHAYKRLVIAWKNYREKHPKANQKRLVEMKKRRRKEAINNKSTTFKIHNNVHTGENSFTLSNIHVIHRPNCRYHQIGDSFSAPTPPSLCPSFADAPAASPEHSDIIDSIHTPNTGIEPYGIPHSQSLNNDADNSSIPSILLNKISIKSNYLDFDTLDKNLQHNQCDCYHQNDISIQSNINNDDEDELEDEDDDEEIKIKQPSKFSLCCDQYIWSHFHTFRKYVSDFVASKYFRRIVLSAIVVNTLSMGIEYHGQPTSLTNALEYSNIVFTSLFAIEMILKIIADGCLKYIKNAYNLFDGGIVLMSVIELQGNKNSGLSVLRTFRLLRVLKLVRFMPTLRRQLVVMLKTMDNVATFFSLLLLFIFIFSILGMHLFGGEFCTIQIFNLTLMEEFRIKCRCCTCIENDIFKNESSCIEERKNFDSLTSAVLTVFQVLTQEDWNEVLYNGMEKTSAWAALYFIALMTFGNYVLFNLLVAILVEGFSTEKGGGTSESGSSTDRLAKADPFKTQALLTGDIEVPANPHEFITEETASNQENRLPRPREVKIMSIPKIAISNEDDSSLRILETRLRINTYPNASASPYKSIIKTRSSQPQSPSSSCTTQSFHTCIESTGNESLDQSSKISVPLKRSHTVSIVKNNSENNSRKRYSSLSQNHSFITVQNNNQRKMNSKQQQHLLNPVRRINSYQASPRKSSDIHLDKSLDLNSTAKRRSTINHFTYPTIQPDNTSSIYGTPMHQESNQYFDNSIRLIIDTDTNTQTTINDQSDMQVDVTKIKTQPQVGIFRACITHLCGDKLFKYADRREDYSLYLFSPNNRFRQFLKRLIVRKSFDYSILLFIALNCITLAMERPSIPPNSTERQFLNITNYIFTVIFSIEMMTKVIAGGLICGPHTYLHVGWNVMDGSLVFISIMDLLIMNRTTMPTPGVESDATTRIFSMLRVFRLLRTLRPLRVISRAPGLKLVVQTLMSSLRPIGHIVVICCTFFIIFGILGVQLFKGKFYYCDGPLARNITTKQQCETTSDHRWKNQQYNFDNLGQALLALFVLSSRDGWVQIMYNGIDAVDIDRQPIRNYNEAKLIYFISFLLLVGFFVLNMFVGVVVENFHKCRAEQEREEKARRTAKRAKKIERKRRRMREIPYYAHFSPWRRRLHDVCNSKYFDLIIAAVIGLNVVTMSLEFYLMPPIFETALDYCNYVFTTVFVFESISKIIALGPFRYFKEKWNQLDTMIVVLSIAGIIMEKMKSGHILPINPTLIRVMRVMRIARVLKLLKMAKGIRALLDTVIQALPQVGNLGLLFFLLFFIFAALGVELFGKLECSDERPCSGLDKHAHFKDFGMAFLTLFRIATGDNWNGIMKDALRQDDSPHASKNHFITAIAPIYFVIFVLMAQFVLVNVVVAVLMKKLDESNRMLADDAEIDEEIERQLEADAHDRDYVEQPLLNDNELIFLNDHDMRFFPLTKQLSLPPNFTFHSMNSTTGHLEKAKTIQVLKGSSLSSIVSSIARTLSTKIDEIIPSNDIQENVPSSARTSTEILYRPTTIISHHRSNTVPTRLRKTTNNQEKTHLSPTYKQNKNEKSTQSQSLLQIQPKRHIRTIDDDIKDDESPS
ncbi:unnamed protein product [Adineta steineri]|uniref:Voltage-dependent T-type calcium channel subunit alpha n=1 Tax=Adineta steineri TaxID=433720 RepID=A0A818UYD7_9BILA|nr:unnamed protein product [Adineta steineri]